MFKRIIVLGAVSLCAVLGVVITASSALHANPCQSQYLSAGTGYHAGHYGWCITFDCITDSYDSGTCSGAITSRPQLCQSYNLIIHNWVNRVCDGTLNLTCHERELV